MDLEVLLPQFQHIFFYKNYKIFTLSLIVLILISSLSSIVALFFVLFFLSGKMFLPISLMVIPAFYIIITGYVNIIAGIPFLDVLKYLRILLITEITPIPYISCQA